MSGVIGTSGRSRARVQAGLPRLGRLWRPEEKLRGVHPPFYDGISEYDDEDVGWMYMPLLFYMDRLRELPRWVVE
jgi:hypothetical protein